MSESTVKPINTLQLPTKSGNTIMVPATAAQKLSSGSATGNPRNKCALQPGHSLMDWVRLGNSGVDLSGTRGRVVPVTTEELARHNQRSNAWMAIRGKVYNVTRYMDFHPGGVDELMRGVGTDATKLFDEVHAWVNYQQLLAKCFIGPLKGVAKLDNSLLKSLQIKTLQDANEFAKPAILRLNTAEVIPRFDWIQQRNELTIYIYTRQFCNPGLILQHKNEKDLQIHVQIARTRHNLKLELQNTVQWPPKSIKISYETGKIEIILAKTQQELWNTYGTLTTATVLEHDVENLSYDFALAASEEINHDSFQLSLTSAGHDTIILLPIGWHVNIETPVKGHLVSRSYTPVNNKYLQTLNEQQKHIFNLSFLIKSYTDGRLSTHLRQLQTSAIVQVSVPSCNFNLQQLASHRNILFLAAGSGLTPFLSLLDPLLNRNTNRMENLRLIYFNKTERDIWCRQSLEQLQKDDMRFSFQNVLSQADDDAWKGTRGHITNELIAPLLDKSRLDKISFIAICGPNAYTTTTLEILKTLEFNTSNIHVFQG